MVSYEASDELTAGEAVIDVRGFASLGYDVMWNITQYCMDIKSIVYLSSTCKLIRYQLDDDENVWAPIAINRGIVSQQRVDERRHMSEQSYDYVPWRSIVRKALCDAKATLWNDIISEDNAFRQSPEAFTVPVWDREGDKKGSDIRTSLRRLGTLDNSGGLCIGRSGVWAVASALRYANTLDTLRLRNQLIRNHGVQLLSLAVCPPRQSNKAILANYEKRLKLAANSAPPELRSCIQRCFSAQSSFLATLKSGFGQSLSVLSLDGNKIEGEEGGEAIAALVTNCPQLIMLNIARNAIDMSGALHIAKSIEAYGSNLSRFFIDENPIGDKAARALVLAFASQLKRRIEGRYQIGNLMAMPFVIISMTGCRLTTIPASIKELGEAIGAMPPLQIHETLHQKQPVPLKARYSQPRAIHVLLGNSQSVAKVDRNVFAAADKQSIVQQNENVKKDNKPLFLKVDVRTSDEGSATPKNKEDKGCMCM